MTADISTRFLEFMNHQDYNPGKLCPKTLLKGIRAFVGATRRGLRGAEGPMRISALKFMELATTHKVLLHWVQFLSSSDFQEEYSAPLVCSLDARLREYLGAEREEGQSHI